jgi:hypothetical protein
MFWRGDESTGHIHGEIILVIPMSNNHGGSLGSAFHIASQYKNDL